MRFSVISGFIMLSFIWIAKGEVDYTDVEYCNCKDQHIFCEWFNKTLNIDLGTGYSVVNYECDWMMEKAKEVFILSLGDHTFCDFSNQRTTSDVSIQYIKDYKMQWTCIIRKSGVDYVYDGILPTDTRRLAKRFPEILSVKENKSNHYVSCKQLIIRSLTDPMEMLFKGRHAFETECLPPDKYLHTASLSCRLYPGYAFCVERCIFGHTLRDGIQQKIYCSPETGWYPHAVQECQPFVDCHAELLSYGSLNCSNMTFTKGRVCTAECYNRTEDGITFKHAASDVYTCDLDGWDKIMPFCLQQGSGVALAQAPIIKRHKKEKYSFDFAREYPHYNPEQM